MSALRSRLSLFLATVGLGLPGYATSFGVDPLAAGFREPPASARPMTFWHWMNGNVTKDGITRDLEAMAKVGIGGAMIFDGGDYLPAGPSEYLQPHWRELMVHTLKEGQRLGVVIGMHNAPGWSSSGGPWVKPEMSMQQLTWTEAAVSGGRRIDLELPRPPANEGYYRDAFVVAFPSLPAEAVPYEQALASVTAGSRAVPKASLSDNQFATTVALTEAEPLIFEFAEPVELHALTALPALKARFPRLQVEASLDGKNYVQVCTVSAPGRHGIVAPGVRSFAPVKARWVRVMASGAGEIADLVFHRAPRIQDWVAKANFDYRVTGQVNLPPPGPAAAAINPTQVVDLTARLQGDRLTWDAPAGSWTILRIGHTSTGKLNVAASAAGRGLEIDKFSAAATEFHFQKVIDRVAADAKAAGAPGPSFVTIDSYEAGMQNWTADFPAEFRRRTGYALTGFMPALFGRIVGDAGISERFLYDFRRVQADLMAERYYGKMHELARERGLRFYVEGYGSGNFDELRVAGLPDVPTTEFWTRTPWTPNRVVKMVTSAAHIYGKSVVGAEAFTGEFKTSRWLEYPYALKALGDEMSAMGVNQFVFHSYVHQPHPDAAPGLTLGPYGFGMTRTNTWFDQSRPWLDTLSRTHFMLRQGTYAADVLFFSGERSPDPSQYALPVVPAGYTYDVVNADVLLNRIVVRDGDYVLPEGGRYKLLVLPAELKGMTPTLLAKLREFVSAGAALAGLPPQFSPTLAGYPQSESEMLNSARELWAQPRVFGSSDIGAALAKLGVAPDFSATGPEADPALSWQHRRLQDGDLYFVGNRERRSREVTVSFRGMAGRQPELWRPESGRITLMPVFGSDGDCALVPLTLDPAESVFVLFRSKSEPGATALTRDGGLLLTARAKSPAPVSSSAGNFTMAIWVKPDTDLRVMPKESVTGRIDETGKYYAIPADPGDRRFGAGHATAGLAVGRNGIFVVERSWESCPAVLVADLKVSGWTHVAVTYREGRPSLYVNGRLVREGLVSGKSVHSGVDSPVPPVDYVLNFPAIEALTRTAGQPPPPSRGQVFYFEGNFIPAVSYPRSLSETEIAGLVAQGMSAPELPVVTDLNRLFEGSTAATFWQAGRYALAGGPAVDVTVPPPREIAGPWLARFQENRGASASVELPALASLHLHPEPGVRHFAGTVTYEQTLDVPEDYLRPDRQVVLDLGRVEVTAEVIVNGQPVATVWKEPYRVDITTAVKAGKNAVEIRVATLWPNRLIGDELLPVENQYGLRDEQGNDPHGIVKLPDWYREGKPKPAGGRVTFSAWNFYDKDEPLVASGLLGPVRLLNPVRVTW